MNTYLEELLADIPPTTLRFFTPTDQFWEFMNSFRSKVIIEAGAGAGYTTEEAKERGFDWMGIDPRVDHVTAARGVYRGNATRHTHTPGENVLVVPRPDHSGWAEQAMRKALEEGCPAIYVGLPENLEKDILDLATEMHYNLIPDMGEDGEVAVVFYPADYLLTL